MVISSISGEKKRFGGRQVGAGRPKGALSRRTKALKEVTDKMIHGKRLPLHIMMENMHYYQDEAIAKQAEFEAAIVEVAKSMSQETYIKALQLFAQIGDARLRAQKCAVDAAPYVHARLSSITMDVTGHEHPRDLPEDAEVARFREEFRRLRSQPYIPPIVEGESTPVTATNAQP
jgi:hypothetical protein